MRVLILTAQSSWPSSYSLSNVTQDQALGFRQSGHEVRVVGCYGASSAPSPTWFHDRVCYEWPSVSGDSELQVDELHKFLDDILEKFQPDLIITHDLIFQYGFGNYARVIHRYADDGRKWLHYIHSVIQGRAPSSVHECLHTLPKGHKVVSLSSECTLPIIKYYNAKQSDVVELSNPIDPGRMRNWSPVVRSLHRDHEFGRVLVSAVLPVCATRTDGKNLPHLLRVFDELDREGIPSKLVIATSSANAHREQEICESFTQDNVVVTSLLFPELAQPGLDHKDISDLLQLSTVFFNISAGEACSLTMAEACIHGLPCVINANLPQLVCRQPPNNLHTHYPTFRSIVKRTTSVQGADPEDEYAKHVALETVNLIKKSGSYHKLGAINDLHPDRHASDIIRAMEISNG